MTICKKHGKERNVIVKSKPSSRGGKVAAVLEYVGCEDCAAGLPAKGEQTTPRKSPPGQKRDIKKSEKEPQQTPAEAIDQAKKVKTIANRFGFKF